MKHAVKQLGVKVLPPLHNSVDGGDNLGEENDKNPVEEMRPRFILPEEDTDNRYTPILPPSAEVCRVIAQLKSNKSLIDKATSINGGVDHVSNNIGINVLLQLEAQNNEVDFNASMDSVLSLGTNKKGNN